MGASQSARKISIENDDAANVIKISDSLVDRLKGGISSGHNDAPSHVSNHGQHGSTPPSPNQPYYYPSFTALQVKKDMEEQLSDNNNYWMRRLEDLELEHKKIDFIMEQEFEKAVENVKQRFRKLPTAHGVPPCLDSKARIIKCFQENSKRPIECANEVKQFSQCVNKQRAELLHNRG